MSRWFRLYDELLDDPKVQMLSPELFRSWVNLLALASRSDGLLPAIDRIAFALRASQSDTQSRLDDLILAGLIDIRPDGKLEPHNWPSRQWKSDDSKERVKKHREAKKRQGNGDVTVTVTPPETESESESETEYKSLPLEQDAAREDSEVQVVKIEPDFGRKKILKGRVSDDLRARAEGLGLPVSALALKAEAEATSNVDGYFQTLCRNRIREQLPGIGDRLIGRAMSTDSAARAKVMELLIHAMETADGH